MASISFGSTKASAIVRDTKTIDAFYALNWREIAEDCTELYKSIPDNSFFAKSCAQLGDNNLVGIGDICADEAQARASALAALMLEAATMALRLRKAVQQ